MPKLVFEFKTQEDLDNWYGFYSDGGGEDGIYEGFAQEGWDYPEIKVTQES